MHHSKGQMGDVVTINNNNPSYPYVVLELGPLS